MAFFDLLWGWADYEPKNWSGESLSVEEEPTCFVVRAINTAGKNSPLYISKTSLTAVWPAKLPTKAEARRIAVNIANLPGLVRKTAESKTVKSSWW